MMNLFLPFIQRVMLCLVATVALLSAGVSSASAATFEITQSDCMASPGGYWWAIQQANANPGRDTIQVRTSFTVDDCTHFPAEQYPDLHVTESLDLMGNGFTAYGNVGWVDPSGGFNRHGVCPNDLTGDLMVGYGGGLIDIGQRNTDNAGIEVTISGLNTSRLTGFAIVRKHAKLTVQDSNIQDTYSVYHQECSQPIIEALDHSDLTLVNTRFNRISVPTDAFGSTSFPVSTSAIKGYGGKLVMDRVTMDGVYGDYTTAIGWLGGSAKIVSSQFVNSHGILLDGGVMDFVNSVYATDIAGLRYNDNFLIANATFTSRASTYWWGAWGDPCDPNPSIRYPNGKPCAPRILGFDASGSTVRLESSALGGWRTDSYPVLGGAASQYSSDAITWVQVRERQNAAALQAILPNALTGAPGLHDQPSFYPDEYFWDITPVLPGLLIEAVANAGTGGVNALINPIDNLPLLKDVFGNARVYANNTRNIGAVQSAEAPVLQASAGNAKVDLSWTLPNTTRTGYEICASTTVLVNPVVGACATPSTLVADPALTQRALSGLSNGVPYWFVVRAVNGGAPGIWSNVAIATPSSVPDAPVLTPTPGDGQVLLSWTSPAANGAVIDGYVLKYRQQGSTSWTSWPFSGTGTTTTVSGLTNGGTYEFEVSAHNGSPVNAGLGQGQGPFGAAMAIPFKPLSLAYPATVNAFVNSAQQIKPSVANNTGVASYTLSAGSLPPGMALNPGTGDITGTPTTAGTYPLTLSLSQSGPPLQTASSSLTVTVANLPPSLQLIYPDLLNVSVGSGPYRLVPSVSGFTGPITFSVAADALPAGLTLDATTGVISGIPSTATSGYLAPTLRASAQGGVEVRQNVLLLAILPTLSYPAVNPTLGSAFTVAPQASPALVAGTYDITSGTLPAGLSLNPATGVISGTPSVVASQVITVRFTTGSQQVSVSVPVLVRAYPITLSYPTLNVTLGSPAQLNPTALIGAKGPVTYSVPNGQLPAGLSLNPSTGGISGTPTGPLGASQVTVTVRDSFTSATVALTINVLAAPVNPAAIPTLNEGGMLLLAALLALLAKRFLPRSSAG